MYILRPYPHSDPPLDIDFLRRASIVADLNDVAAPFEGTVFFFSYNAILTSFGL